MKRNIMTFSKNMPQINIRQLGQHVGFVQILDKKGKVLIDIMNEKCCMNLNTCSHDFDKALIYIPTTWIEGGLPTLKKWIKFINDVGFRCKYISTFELKYGKYKRPRKEKAFEVKITYNSDKFTKEYPLIVFTALRYLYSPKYKGLVSATYQLKKDYPKFSNFKCLYLAHYNKEYDNEFSLRANNAAYPLSLKQLKEKLLCNDSGKYINNPIHNIFSNGTQKNLNKNYKNMYLYIGQTKSFQNKYIEERKAYIKTIRLFKQGRVIELLNFLKNRKIEDLEIQ